MKSIILLLVFLVCFGVSCDIISAGSYPYAEIYQYKVQEDSLINVVTSIKEKDSNLVPPIELRLRDGRSDSTDYWYHIYFFNKSKNEIIHTWIRGKDRDITNFAFVGINEGINLGNWKEINKDYNKVDNARKKKEFENLILSKISYAFIR